MTAQAVGLNDAAGGFLGADGLRDVPADERGDVVEAGAGLDDIFGDESVRGVAVVAGGPALVAGVVPAFIGGIHHVAVVAGDRVIAEVGGEIGDDRADRQHEHQSHQADDEG